MRTKGFTLVEVVVASVIISIMALCIGGVFTSGIRLWKKAQSLGHSSAEILLDLEGVSRNFRQSLDIPDVPFRGDSKSIEFPTLVGNSIFKIIYSFDAFKKKLLIRKIGYEDVLADRLKKPPQSSIFDADKVSFEYLVLDKDEDSCSWEKEIDEDDGIPAIIKMSVEIDDENIEKFIFIPLQRASK